MQNLESLSRTELQALIKTHGLKGANKKTAELVNILQEFFNNPLTPSPSVNDMTKEIEIGPEESLKQDNDLKEQLLNFLSEETVQVLENHELLHWDLIHMMEFKDFDNLGLKMASFLKVRKVVNEKFPSEKQVMVPISEIKSIVQNILDSKISQPRVKPLEDSVVKIVKKTGKYDNIKSKVAQQWNKSRV